jgi:hypothetical protein
MDGRVKPGHDVERMTIALKAMISDAQRHNDESPHRKRPA